MQKYDHTKIEKKWQDKWESTNAFAAKDNAPDKSYLLIEFPYPSGDGLHVGHIRSWTAMDVVARKRRAQGKNVLYPIGWDAFGLPAENYAIKTGIHPKLNTKQNTDNFRRQIKAIGISFDWSREINTTDPAYYKWTQWIFLQLFKKGLAYKTKTLINWCPKDKVTLANEEVVDGACERCGTPVEKREKEQWMLAITKYAQRLYDDLDTVDYISAAKAGQRNWIGPSEGAEIEFPIAKKYKFVLLHGYKGGPGQDFFPWLKRELEAQGHTVIVPLLPHSKEENAKESLDMEAALAAASYDQNTIVVGHSLGCIVGLKIAEQYPIGGLVLAEGFLDGKFIDHERPFVKEYNWNIDVVRIKRNAGWIKLLQDTSDDIISIDQAKRLSEKLSVPLELVTAGQPHFNSAAEPAVLKAAVPAIKVFTTRPDTLFGATYMVLAPEHILVKEFAEHAPNKTDILSYIEAAKSKSEIERSAEGKEKTGVELRGVKAINPANQEEIPVYIADYVIGGYGTGAIMAVPAHDERDRQFAEKFNLPIKEIELEDKKEITERVGGKLVTTYKLRDWVFGRQRYWGEPIPMINCPNDGWVPVPEDQLPVRLPDTDTFLPGTEGESPLANMSEWVNTTCPTCGGAAKRETDVMPQWAGSSWYYLRFADPKNTDAFAAEDKLNYWTPVDWYNGGMEHTTLHLLYSRFWHKVLFDLGLVPSSEPYLKRTSHGLILAEGGEKMSKSKGNTVSPDTLVETFGADSLRLYEMFIGPFDQPVVWSTNSVMGVRRFLERVWSMQEKIADIAMDIETETLLHQTIEKVTKDIEALKMNTAVSALMILSNHLQTLKEIPKAAFGPFIKLLAPFAPHMANEIASGAGYPDGAVNSWPIFDSSKINKKAILMAVQVNGKVRTTIELSPTATEEEALAAARANPVVAKWLGEGQEKKAVYVAGKIINFVVG